MLELIFNLAIFILSFGGLWWSSDILVRSVKNVSLLLGWKEFVVAFVFVALFSTIPNFMVDVTAALKKVPHLALGDIIGTNVVNLSLIVGISALISKAGLSVPSKTVIGSSYFTLISAILPFILLLDGDLSRADGVLLILLCFIYLFWLFTKKGRFEKVYDGIEQRIKLDSLLKSFVLLLFSLFILIFSSQGIINSALYFSEFFNVSLLFIGASIIGFGTALPELFFCIQAAKRSQDWMIAGDIMGSVIFSVSLVLGIVVLIEPILSLTISQILIARIFLIISAVLFFWHIRTDKKITRTEGIFFVLLYFMFLLSQIIFFEREGLIIGYNLDNIF